MSLNRDVLEQFSNEIIDLLIQKNNDYGDSFSKTMSKFGDLSFLIRLTDKICRLEVLFEKGFAEVKDESFDDTVTDIIGYCLLYKYYKETSKSD